MNISLPPSASPQFSHFTTWLDTTPLGTYILAGERAWFDAVTVDIFGYRAMQLQLPRIDFLRASRIPYRTSAAEGSGAAVETVMQALPVASQSLDLLALPHVLDFADHPHAVLREAERVLVPGGRLLITGFNPWSLWVCRRICKSDRWVGNGLTLPRLKDWLSLMGFETMQASYFGYTLPIQNTKWLTALQWLDQAGNRWWPRAGAIYCLDMIKRVYGVKPITPRWHDQIPVRNTVVVSDVSCRENNE